MKKKIIEEIAGLRNQLEREVGIEIEIEGRNLQVRVPGWTRTEDGSLRGESAEYVLTKPVLAKDVKKLLARLETKLAENGALLDPSDRCGVHIHINCQNMTCEQVIKFAILYLVVENILVKWCGEDREGNLFCLRAKDAEYLIQCMTSAVHNNDLSYIYSANVRYASINFNALGKFGSIEFRSLRTPKEFTRIIKWVDMLTAIKKASLQYEEARHIIEDVSMKEPDVFLRDIFGPLADELDKNKNLLWDGVRRVQEVAYASFFIPEKRKGLESLPGDYWRHLYSLHDWLIRSFPNNGATLLSFKPDTGSFSYLRNRPRGSEEKRDTWDRVHDIEREVDLSSINWDHQTDYQFVKQKYEEFFPPATPRQPVIHAPEVGYRNFTYQAIAAEDINNLIRPNRYEIVRPRTVRVIPAQAPARPDPVWQYIEQEENGDEPR